jgi:hypothetical protein
MFPSKKGKKNETAVRYFSNSTTPREAENQLKLKETIGYN